MKYKDYTRSPQYGKIYSYDEKGKQTHELDLLQLEVEHEGKTFTIGKLLERVTSLSSEVEMLKLEAGNDRAIAADLSRKISTQKEKTQLLTEVIKKLTAEVSRIKSNNKGI